MKVAVCFFGQPRLLNNPYGWFSQKYHIIDKYNADVYIHSWINNEEKEFDYADQVQNEFKFKEDKNASNTILNRYKPKKYFFEKSKYLSLDDNTRKLIKDKPNYSINNEHNHLSQLYSISKSLNLIEENYDWIILTRFDVYIMDFPNLYQLDKNKLYVDATHDYLSDLIFFGSQEKMKNLDCYERIPELCQSINNWFIVELKKLAIKNEERIPMRVCILRTNSLEPVQY